MNGRVAGTEYQLFGLSAVRARHVPKFCSAVTRVVGATVPVCSTTQYADLLLHKTTNRVWLARLLRSYGREEVRAARRLVRLRASLVALIPDSVAAMLVSRHESDERRHVDVFHALADRVFREEVTRNSPAIEGHQVISDPGFDGEAELLREAGRVALGEFKNRFHLITLERALARHSDLASHDVASEMRRLVRDETNHVYYSARVWDEIALLLPAKTATDILCDEYQMLDAKLRRVTSNDTAMNDA